MKYIKLEGEFNVQKDIVNAVTNNDSVELNKLIKKFKGSIDFNYNKGWTPLLYAALFDCEKTAKILIKKGANLNVTTDDGETSLMVAAKHNNRSVLEVLLDAGADWFITNLNKSSIYYNNNFIEYIPITGTEKWIAKKYPTQYEEYIMRKKAEIYNI